MKKYSLLKGFIFLFLACTDDIDITDREGLILSPNYPSHYSSHLSSSCHISGNVGDVITVW